MNKMNYEKRYITFAGNKRFEEHWATRNNSQVSDLGALYIYHLVLI